MAINAPIIRPDPVGAYNQTFQTADTSARDYARLQMQRQAMEEAAVQRARENKANDFKLMMAAVGRQDDLAQQGIANQQRAEDMELRRSALGLQAYGAETSRMGLGLRQQALRTRARANGDPLGLGGPAYTAPPASDEYDGTLEAIEPAPVPAGLPDGGYMPPDPAEFYQGQGDTGPYMQLMPSPSDGQGMAPQDAVQTLPAGPVDAMPQDMLADMPSRPGAVQPLIDAPPPAQDADVQLPPPQDEMVGPPAPPPSTAEAEALLPPPVLRTPSFSDVDISQESRNRMFQLQQTNAELTQRAMIANQQAARTAGYMKQVSPELLPVYQAKLEEQMTESITAKRLAAEADAQSKDVEANKVILQKRQAELSALSVLDDVLPGPEKEQLILEAANPATGGAADRKIAVLKTYDQVRRAQKLKYPSNGLETAEAVARAGLALETPTAQKAREAATTVRLNLARLEAEEAKPDADTKAVEAYKKNILDNEPQADYWLELESELKKAVKADVRKTGSEPEPPPAAPAPAPTAPAVGQGFLEKNKSKDKPPEGNAFWTEGKQQAARLANMDGGTDAQGNVIPRMSKEELEAIANRTSPLTDKMTSSWVAPGDSPSAKAYVKEIAERIAPNFKKPTAKGSTGRRGEVTPEDFLVEAAKDRLRDLRAGIVPSIPKEKQTKLDAVRARFGYKVGEKNTDAKPENAGNVPAQ